MGIVYQKDCRSGITYAYDNHRVWSEEKGKYVNKRKLIGRVANMETKEIVPTDGRCKKLSPYLSKAEREKMMKKGKDGMRDKKGRGHGPRGDHKGHGRFGGHGDYRGFEGGMDAPTE